jgi:response regulator NasT
MEGCMTTSVELNDDPGFAEEVSPTVSVDHRFVIRSVNQAFLTATRRSHDELVDVNIFDAFPDNPDATTNGSDNLLRVLTTVLDRGAQALLPVQRHDITDPQSGEWITKYWTTVGTPLVEDGKVVGAALQVEDLTPSDEGLRAVLELYAEVLASQALTEGGSRRLADSARAFALAARETKRLSDEVVQLRRALTTRATIDQAKGIVMAEHGGSPDEAFAVLKEMSSETNVRIADVAAALVYRTQNRSLPG